MDHTIINTPQAPAPGNYSQGRLVSFPDYSILFVSGQTGNLPTSNEILPDIESQTRQTLLNIQAIIQEAGGTLNDIVHVTVYMKNMSRDKTDFEKVYLEFFPGTKPARALVEVTELPLISELNLVMLSVEAYILKK